MAIWALARLMMPLLVVVVVVVEEVESMVALTAWLGWIGLKVWVIRIDVALSTRTVLLKRSI